MTLFDQVLSYIKSAGHAVDSEEHKLLNTFVAYLGSNSVVAGFFEYSGTDKEKEVVANFASTIVPVDEAAQAVATIPVPASSSETPAPVTSAPVAEPAKETVLQKLEASVENLLQEVKEAL